MAPTDLYRLGLRQGKRLVDTGLWGHHQHWLTEVVTTLEHRRDGGAQNDRQLLSLHRGIYRQGHVAGEHATTGHVQGVDAK